MLEKKFFNVEFKYLAVLFCTFANLGFLVENIFRLITKGIFDSRFHILPFISPYGLIPLAILIVINDVNDIRIFNKRLFKEKNKKSVIFSNLISLLLFCLFVMVGELAVGNIYDHFFGVELWNYSNMPLHIGKYNSLITTLGYGSGVYLITKFVFYPLLNLIKKIKHKWVFNLFTILMVLSIIDTLIMMFNIIVNKSAPVYYRFKFW